VKQSPYFKNSNQPLNQLQNTGSRPLTKTASTPKLQSNRPNQTPNENEKVDEQQNQRQLYT
jgi:hypothetical protein